MSYKWSCVQTAPELKQNCIKVLKIPSFVGQTVRVETHDNSDLANFDSTNAVATLTVTVSDSTRSSSASVEVRVIAALAPEVTIDSNILSKVSIDEKVKLLGKVVSIESGGLCSWSIVDSDINLNERL